MQRDEKLKITISWIYVKFSVRQFIDGKFEWAAFFIIASIAMVVKVAFNY